MFKFIVISLIVLVSLSYSIFLFKDIYTHRAELKSEKPSSKWLPVSSFVIFFLSTFGISDFAISTVVYSKLGWVDIKKLPGTLNTQGAIPFAVMALSYVSSVNVGIKTLIVCIISQMVGAYIGPRIVVNLSEISIKRVLSIGLLVAACLIFAGQMGWIKSTGMATELYGWKLLTASLALFTFGMLNNIGIGSFSVTMVTVYLLGMDPLAAFPIMMGACTFSIPIGSMQFIKYGRYNRKITLSSAIFGIVGVLTAVLLVQSLATYMLKWLVIIVLLYSSYTMMTSLIRQKKDALSSKI
ncbi:sulfite exporter TauE/SafE family protein [Vagococcus vulneris]|uniref:Probable membrane transporter protein n=1 Tax=Vagococcus vulneris TaxID=1977869 RepID=A0A429ZXD3_9ENTE|nr:sulfite exporter TauE/SafE family protein [Vagococcus vulneris]RST98430.1 hypothetical protein CBF37_07915 [Vagococcus vulneris]